MKKIIKSIFIIMILLLGSDNVIGINPIFKTVEAASDISLSNLPRYPENGQKYWVIFKEGYRGERIEMSTFNANINVGKEPWILWDRNLTVQDAEVIGDYNQYCLNDDKNWEQIGSYHLLTDYATTIIASNLNVFDTDGKLVVASSVYNSENEEPIQFTIGRDNNLFGHSSESFFLNTPKDYRINALSYRNALYRNQSDNYCNLLLQKQFEEWGGSCYGISASMMYAYNKGYDIKKYIAEESKNYPYYASVDWPVFNSKTKDMIQVFQLSQFRSDATYTDITNNSFMYKTFGIGSDIKTLLRGIVNQARESNYLKPFLLGVTYKEAGHALVVCGLDGKVNGYYKVAICDPNCQSEYRYLMINENYSSFHMEDKNGNTIYSGKIDSNNFKELKYVTYEDAYSKVTSKKSGNCEVIVNVDSSFYMTTDVGTYLSYDGEKFTGTAKIDSVSSAIKTSDDNESSSWIIELLGINKVNFSNMSPSIEVDCLFDSDEYANVTGNNLTTISFEDDKGVSIEGTDAIYTLSISAKNTDNTLIHTSGKVTNRVTYEYDGADIKINGSEDISVNKITDEGIEALDKSTDPVITVNGKNNKPNVNLKKVKIGDRVSIGRVTYKITNLKKKTVEYFKTKSTSAKISIPATVKLNGITFKVTRISDNAFKNRVKLKTLIIGKNVITIGENAFCGCQALKTFTISSKITKIGANAFKGCRKLKTITIKSTKLTKNGLKNALKGSSVTTIKLTEASKKKYKRYVKYFTKSNCGKNVQIKK